MTPPPDPPVEPWLVDEVKGCSDPTDLPDLQAHFAALYEDPDFAFPFRPELYKPAPAADLAAVTREWARGVRQMRPADAILARSNKIAVLSDPMFGLGEEAARALVDAALREARGGRA